MTAGPVARPRFFMRWQRFLVVGGFLASGLGLAYISFAWRFMKPQPPGGILNLPETLSTRRSGEPPMTRPTRLGPAPGLAEGVRTWNGTLLDAGCQNLNSYALRMRARETPPEAAGPGQEAAAARSSLVPEEVKENRVPDLSTRQTDTACAVTAATIGFALLLDNGQLKDLDEGGNTFAWQALQATASGQAVLAGKQRGVNPHAELRGTLRDQEIIVESLLLER